MSGRQRDIGCFGAAIRLILASGAIGGGAFIAANKGPIVLAAPLILAGVVAALWIVRGVIK